MKRHLHTTLILTLVFPAALKAATPLEQMNAAQRRRACVAGNTDACDSLYSSTNLYIPTSPKTLAQRLDQRCTDGDDTACEARKLLPQTPTWLAAEELNFYQSACAIGEPESCFDLASILDTVTPRAPAQAAVLYQKACDSDITRACNNLGVLYLNGDGVPEDLTQALALFSAGCDSELPTSCGNLANMYQNELGVPRDLDKATELHRYACDKGYGGSCYNLAMFYDQGEHVQRDRLMARSLFEESCENGYSYGCTQAGALNTQTDDGLSQNLRAATNYYRKGCNGGDALGCYHLARMYKNGWGSSVRPDEAEALYKRACDAGYPPEVCGEK